MNTKLCVLIIYKIEKNILNNDDLHIHFHSCRLSYIKCNVHVILSLALLFPKINIKECLYFLFLLFDMSCHKS